jgi:hypothetical protein
VDQPAHQPKPPRPRSGVCQTVTSAGIPIRDDIPNNQSDAARTVEVVDLVLFAKTAEPRGQVSEREQACHCPQKVSTLGRKDGQHEVRASNHYGHQFFHRRLNLAKALCGLL